MEDRDLPRRIQDRPAPELRNRRASNAARGEIRGWHRGISQGVRYPVMMSLGEISDRFEIQRLMALYSNAIDLRDFDRLDIVFTPDAYIDYRAMGGIDGR